MAHLVCELMLAGSFQPSRGFLVLSFLSPSLHGPPRYKNVLCQKSVEKKLWQMHTYRQHEIIIHNNQVRFNCDTRNKDAINEFEHELDDKYRCHKMFH